MVKANSDETFLDYRPRLMGLAYRMLGAVTEAEDVVQEAWLRWRQYREPVSEPEHFLMRMVTRQCIDRYRSARVQREAYVGPWVPEPLVTDEGPEQLNESHRLLSLGALYLMESLSPLERAVFVLAEGYDWRASEIAELLERREAHCRQLLRRARTKLAEGGEPVAQRAASDTGKVHQLLEAMGSANWDAVAELLAEDVALVSDGGGRVTAATRPLHGVRTVARFLMGIARGRTPSGLAMERCRLNGMNALVVGEGHVMEVVMVAEGVQGELRTLFMIRNPDKLKALRDQHAGLAARWTLPD